MLLMFICLAEHGPLACLEKQQQTPALRLFLPCTSCFKNVILNLLPKSINAGDTDRNALLHARRHVGECMCQLYDMHVYAGDTGNPRLI